MGTSAGEAAPEIEISTVDQGVQILVKRNTQKPEKTAADGSLPAIIKKSLKTTTEPTTTTSAEQVPPKPPVKKGATRKAAKAVFVEDVLDSSSHNESHRSPEKYKESRTDGSKPKPRRRKTVQPSNLSGSTAAMPEDHHAKAGRAGSPVTSEVDDRTTRIYVDGGCVIEFAQDSDVDSESGEECYHAPYTTTTVTRYKVDRAQTNGDKDYSATLNKDPTDEQLHHPVECYHGDRIQQNIVVKNSRRPANSSIHMSLSVEEDMQMLLLETTTLRRLGHFTKAIDFYEQRLDHHLGNEYVRVLFAQCLFDGGQYKKLETIAKDYSEECLDRGLDLFWRHILCLTNWRMGGHLGNPAEVATVKSSTLEYLSMLKPSDYNSIETQVLCHGLQNFAEHVSESVDIAEIYAHFLSKGLIWQFRDLLYSLQLGFEFHETLEKLLHFRTGNLIELRIAALCEDWDCPTTSESCSLAIVEIFTHLALQCMGYSSQTQDVDKCMSIAQRHAEFLIATDRDNINTRPCLQWMITRNIREIHGPGTHGLQYFDHDSYDSAIVFLPKPIQFPSDHFKLCIPERDPVPPWKPRGQCLSAKMRRTTRVVLEAAEKLGDITLQTACWRQVAYQEPERALDATNRIIEISKDSGNNLERVGATLFQCILVQGQAEKQYLYDAVIALTTAFDLTQSSSFHGRAVYSVLEWLAPSPQMKGLYAAMAKEYEQKE